MPLNKLDNFIKNTEGRILYVSPSDLDSTDSITNEGNSLAQPFKTLQRALLEAGRFSYVKGNNNDFTEKTTILLMPGAHTIDNRPGFAVYNNGGTATTVSPSGQVSPAIDTLSLTLESNFDLTQDDNILYKFNSVNGGVIVPRGTSVVGLDLRKTKLRPKYVPNPTDSNVPNSAIFRVTGACYFWQFCLFDGDETGLVYTDPRDFSNNNQSKPTFSHNKLTCFEYADGINDVGTYGLTDLDMYYSKLSNAYNLASGKDIDEKYPDSPLGFAKQRPEWEIVGAFANDPVQISYIVSGTGGTASAIIKVRTIIPHNFIAGTPIKIRGVGVNDYNVSTKVQNITSETEFTYLLENFRDNLPVEPSVTGASVTIETDTVSGASPYIFNISLRSVWGMNGMYADGSKASGFRSMVVAQFTGVALQKDDRAFAKYNNTSRAYESIAISRVAASDLSGQSSSTIPGTAYHLDSDAVYRSGWETSHIKVSNDSFIQIVSVFAIGFTKHFDCETGGDMSITNSNSNFGQISLNSYGFKKEAFAKDDKAFVTSIIAPRAIVSEEANADWMALDVAVTTSLVKNPDKNRLYLYGFTSPDDYPPVLTQGYRIGAQVGDKLYYTASGVEYSADILMSDGVTSSVKEYTNISAPALNKFTIGTHKFNTGEKVIIISDDGDLPENIVENTVYFAITSSINATRSDGVTLSNQQIQLASSKSNASTGTPITVYGGTNLRILSRVSDKDAGDIGSPIQYDEVNGQWFIHTNANSGVYNGIINESGVDPLLVRTEPSYFKRKQDARSLDEKIYKVRVVIPKESVNAKNPENSFIIQPSSSTGYRNNTDANASTITKTDYDYNRNLSLIANCERNGTTVTVTTELRHDLKDGDAVNIKYVTDNTNPTGKYDFGYNGTFTVESIVDNLTFTYKLPAIRVPGTFTNSTSDRISISPRFERNNLQKNLYAYRNEIIQEYIEGIQDGVYHMYVLNANNSIPGEFSDFKYSQNIVDLYPQLDRDNIDDSPLSAKSFAKRAPLGEVVTSNLKKSITKEAVDTFLTSFNVGLNISNVTNSASIATITFEEDHKLAGIVTHASLSGGQFYGPGTFYNVKLYDNFGRTNWRGATAKVVVSASTSSITSVDIQSPGSAYSLLLTPPANQLHFDRINNSGINASITFNSTGISSAVGNVVQFTGSTTTPDSYYRISSVTATNAISIAKTAGDPDITDDQYALVIGPSVKISSNTSVDVASGITTFTCSSPHGLVTGNRFKVIDSNNNNLGNYIVQARDSITTFTAVTNANISATNGWILKHGLSANDATSDSSAENLAVRGVPLFDNEVLIAGSEIPIGIEQFKVSSPVGASAITKRFPLGSYIQIDDEIMRIVRNTLIGVNSDEITVIRGALATRQTDHDNGSLIKKIKPLPIEFRRPSIIRASGHTFEYLGYGPGNYSTGLPQVQVKTLTEREDFLSQSQERSAGVVVYTGMNSKGDSFVGNQKKSSATGEEISFDTPIPTITGVDPSRLSVVFDEVTIKERLVVEGGNSNTVLSQFDGPVTFNKEVKINDQVTLTKPANSKSAFTLKVNDEEQSTAITNGAVIIKGGVGIAKNLNVGGNTTFTGTLAVIDDVTLNKNVTIVGSNTGATELFKIKNGSSTDKFTVDSSSGNTSIAGTLDVTDNVTLNKNVTIVGSDTGATELFKIKNGSSTDKFTVDSSSGNTSIAGTLDVTGTITGTSLTVGSGGITGGTITGTSLTVGSGGITGGTITGTSLSVGSGGITGGTITGTSLSVGSGGITGGTITGSSLSVGSGGITGGTITGSSLSVTGNISADGDVTAFASDIRLKTNIEPIKNALDKVLNLNGFTYNFNEIGKELGFDPSIRHAGVSAQEVQAVLPEVIAPAPVSDDYITVKYEKLVALLIEAIKELSNKVEELEKKSN
jgi:hypothetical protein